MSDVPAMNTPDEESPDLREARAYEGGQETEVEDRFRNERCLPQDETPAEG